LDELKAKIKKKESMSAKDKQELLKQKEQVQEEQRTHKRLKDAGFTEYGSYMGPTFPGIKPEQLANFTRKDQKQLGSYPDPQMEIENVTLDGKVTITFN
jgi:beta-N-acetylglucosaminidase